MKNILILGSGGREDALAWGICKSSEVHKVYCIPGNVGTKKYAENVDIRLTDHPNLLKFVKDKNIDLTIVGPEGPLDDGLVDYFTSHKQRIFGPSKYASQLESSKIFARNIMKEYNIPHPDFIPCSNEDDVHQAKNTFGFPIVIKADGLAAGKGVIICNDDNDFQEAIKSFFNNNKFGNAASKISVERCLKGPELSVFTVCNGKDYIIINNAQDHKRVFDNDLGPNTGGMGAYAPTPLYNDTLEKKVKKSIIEPTLQAMVDKENPFVGFLYIGLMMVEEEPYVIEYNVRMGDPETQVVIPLLKTPLYSLINGIMNNDKVEFENIDGYAVTVVLSSDGYPGNYEKGKIIHGLEDIKEELIFHAGTVEEEGKILTSGGRVLNVIGFGYSLKVAIDNAYRLVSKIKFENKYFRTDIGKKGLISKELEC